MAVITKNDQGIPMNVNKAGEIKNIPAIVPLTKEGMTGVPTHALGKVGAVAPTHMKAKLNKGGASRVSD